MIEFNDIARNVQRLDEATHFNIAYNADCMEFLKNCPDKAFDLAVCDPPYGGCSQTVNVEREREPHIQGKPAGFEKNNRSRFGQRFDKYYIGNANGRNMVEKVPDGNGGYL